MNKLAIKRTDFDKALKRVQDYSNTLPDNPQFEKFETEGWFFGLNDHNVSGYEMNGFVEKLQERLTIVNRVFHGIIKEFAGVYQVFDALDKEYVAGILNSLKEAHQAIVVAQKACDGNTVTLEQLRKTVEKLLQVSNDLSVFKEECTRKLNRLEQKLLVLDKFSKDIAQLQSHQNSFMKQYEEVSELIKQNIIDDINLLQTYINDHDLRLQKLSNKQTKDTSRIESQLEQKEQAIMSWIEELLTKQAFYRKRMIVAYVISVVSMVLSIVSICLSVM